MNDEGVNVAPNEAAAAIQADVNVARNFPKKQTDNERLDACILQFDQAWQAGFAPRIEDYLSVDEASYAAEFRRKVVAELVMVDMEYRWRRRLDAEGFPPRRSGEGAPSVPDAPLVEDYLRRYHDFAADPGMILPLVVNEYRVRHRWGDRPGHEEFIQRFGDCGDDLRRALRLCDAQLGSAIAHDDVGLSCRCPSCHCRVEVPGDLAVVEVVCALCGARFEILGGTPQVSAPRQFGRFELWELLGDGSFGAVWKAYDTELQRIVAVKIAHRHIGDPELLHEARSASALRHPGIVAVHEIGREGERTFMVSDYIDGETLDVWAHRRLPTFREVASMCLSVAEALHYAHASGVIHRDLKPANILVDARGAPYITDFGLAKRSASQTTVTHEGKLLGAPAYMSPEQAAGDAHQCDARSDVYSLGVILFELLTGEPPFRGKVAMVLRQVLQDEPTHPQRLNAQIPLDLATICLKCMEKAPAARYAAAQDLAADLARFLRGEPIVARPIGRIAKAWRWKRRNPMWVALATVVAISGCAIVSVFVWHLFQLEKEQAANRLLIKELRRDRYVSDMHEAADAWRLERLVVVRQMLEQHLPIEGVPDERDFIWHYLWRSLNANRTWLYGHTHDVLGGVFSPDGSRVATTSADSKVRVFDAESSALLAELSGHRGEVNCVMFLEGNDRLLSGGDDGTIRCWDVARRAEASPAIAAHKAGVMCFARSRDGKTLVSGSWDGSVKLWNLATMTKVRELTCGTEPVRSVAFVPDTNRLVVLAEKGPLQIWNLDDESSPALIDVQVKSAFTLALHPNGRLAVVAGQLYRLQLVDLRDGEVIATVPAHGDWIKGAWFVDQGQTLITVSHDNRAIIWDVTNDGRLRQRQSLELHADAIMAGAMSPDESRLLTCSRDHTAVLWRFRQRSDMDVIYEGDERIRAIAVSPDGRTVATSTFNHVWVHDSKSRRLVAKLVPRGSRFTHAVAISPDGRYLAAASNSGSVLIWELAALALQNSQPSLEIQAAKAANSLAFDAESRTLATSHDDGTVKIWRVSEGTLLREFLIEDSRTITNVACVHANQSVIARCNPLRYITARHVVQDIELWRIEDTYSTFALTADERHLACVAMDKTIRVFDVASGDEVTRLSGDREETTRLAFAPDGRILATTTSAGALKLWSVDRRKEIMTLMEKGFDTSPFIFSPDGRTLYAGLDRGDGTHALVAFRAASQDTPTQSPLAD